MKTVSVLPATWRSPKLPEACPIKYSRRRSIKLGQTTVLCPRHSPSPGASVHTQRTCMANCPSGNARRSIQYSLALGSPTTAAAAARRPMPPPLNALLPLLLLLSASTTGAVYANGERRPALSTFLCTAPVADTLARTLAST